MPSFNSVLLMGNVTRDPQLRQLPSQTVVADFGLAVNRKFRSADGEEREEVCFVDCTAFGKQAEVISQYCQKGKPLFIQGRLRYDSWEDKQGGGKRSRLTVVVENFQFVGGRDAAGSSPGTAAGSERPGAPHGEHRQSARGDKGGDGPANRLRARRPVVQQADIPF